MVVLFVGPFYLFIEIVELLFEAGVFLIQGFVFVHDQGLVLVHDLGLVLVHDQGDGVIVVNAMVYLLFLVVLLLIILHQRVELSELLLQLVYFVVQLCNFLRLAVELVVFLH